MLQAKLVSELTTTKREVSLLAEKEIEYAKQNHNRAKEIKALRDRYVVHIMLVKNKFCDNFVS